ncbi:MAG: hypothetical protein MUE59_03530 [Thiobacillaceae bacterium]|jgi:hypothetical protein|nr:hypothetical protein [Thiobacillaceae bacterium]
MTEFDTKPPQDQPAHVVIESLRQQLAECQAREKVLRDASSDLIRAPMDYTDDEYQQKELARCLNAVRESLIMPSDSTALDTMLKTAKREALLEAISVCEGEKEIETKDRDDDIYNAALNDAIFSLNKSISRMAKELE